MKNFPFVLTIIFILFSACTISAQTIDEDYYDGSLYFKFNDDSDKVVENIANLSSIEHEDIARILGDYGIVKLDRPFLVINTPIFDRTYQIEFTEVQEVENLIKELELLPYMEYAEKVPIMRSTYTPNDPNQNTQYSLDIINATQAWDLHTGGNATVAIVDDAVFIDHLDLAPNIWTNPGEIPSNGVDDDNNGYVDDIHGWDAADNDSDPNPPTIQTASGDFTHGTHCAGIASGATDNGIGMASIGFNTKVIAVKGKADDNTGDGLGFIWPAFAYAVASGADVISCSWGGGGPSTTDQNLVNTANNNGQLVIAAAGNDGTDEPHYPSAYNGVIAVANTNQSDVKNGSSNYGNWVDISAPGTQIYSTLAATTTSFGNQSGTSMACPMVAGLAALMRSYNPFLTNAEIEDCIKNTSVDINNLNPTFFGLLGAGRIDAFAAIQCAAPNSAPILQFSTNSNSGNVFCPGESLTFFDNSFYTPESWSWSFPGGIPATSTEQNPTIYYSSPGVYDVTFSATNEFGTSTETYTAYVNVDGSVSSDAYLEDFESGNLFGWTSENPNGDAQWKLTELNGTDDAFGNYALSINNHEDNSYGARDAIVSPKINLYGRSTATLEIDYAYRRHVQGESDSLIIKASLDGGATFPITLFSAADDGNYSLATYVILNGNFIPNNSIDWCGEGSVGADCISFDITQYINADDFRLRFENFSRNGNNFYIDNIRVTSDCISNTVVPQADFEADRMGCNTLTTQFNDISTGVADTWSWTFAGGTPSTSTERNPIVTYGTPGIYEVSLMASNPEGNSTMTKTEYITVSDQSPNANFNILVASWYTVKFENSSTNGVEYVWDFGDGTSSNEASPIHQYADVGSDYTVVLTVTNGCGTDTYSETITTTSIDDNLGEGTSFSIFPNPNNGDFAISITGKGNSNASIRVFDMLGKTVYQGDRIIYSDDWQDNVSLNGIATGTYVIEVSVDGLSSYRKMVVR